MQSVKTLNAGIYPRVSTMRQVQEGFSMEAQRDNLTYFANSQGWNVYGDYGDEGISGKSVEDRPGVKRLINDIKLKKIDIVVLYKFDRLTRDSRDTEDFIELIQNYNILVYALSGGKVDVSTPSGRFNTRILGAAAQFEREQIVDRVVDGFIKKVKKGYSLCSSTVTYGYDRPKHQEIQTINPEEAKVVKRIFKLYVNEGKSFTEICDILNSEKVPTKNKGKIRKRRFCDEKYVVNSIWQAKCIRNILANVTYIGKVRYGVNREKVSIEEADKYENRGKGFVAEGLHEPIIDEKTFQKAQEKLAKIKRVYKTKHPKEETYYCGFLKCGLCGNQLTTTRTNHRDKKDGKLHVHIGYRCLNHEKKLCLCMGMSHKKVEKAFLNYISKIQDLENVEEFEYNSETEDDKNELSIIKNRLSQKKVKLKQIMTLFVDDNLTYDEYKSMKESLENDIKSIEKEIKKMEKNLKPIKEKIDKTKISKKISEHWENLTNAEKREFLTLFIEEIIIVNRNNDRVNGLPEILDVKFYEK